MELKDFQKTSLERIKKYLELVRKEQDSGNINYASIAAWDSLKSVFNLTNAYQKREKRLR